MDVDMMSVVKRRCRNNFRGVCLIIFEQDSVVKMTYYHVCGVVNEMQAKHNVIGGISCPKNENGIAAFFIDFHIIIDIKVRTVFGQWWKFRTNPLRVAPA